MMFCSVVCADTILVVSWGGVGILQDVKFGPGLLIALFFLSLEMNSPLWTLLTSQFVS